MAQGNMGIELIPYYAVARDCRILHAAVTLLESSLRDGVLESIGQADARPYFEKNLQRARQYLGRLKPHSHDDENQQPEYQSEFHKDYVRFCHANRLFLNFSLSPSITRHNTRDSFRISVVAPIADRRKPMMLFRTINEIKERFATCRFLLFEARRPTIDMLPFDGLTTYADMLDYGISTIQGGKLKSAYEGAFNVLDKIAVFLNEYLELGDPPRQATFNRIWRCRDKWLLRTDVAQRANKYLYALYDLARDLGAEGEWADYRLLRNRLTHDYVVLHVEGSNWNQEVDGQDRHLSYHQIADKALSLMRLTRAAVMYLITFVALEENAKHGKMEGLIAEQPQPPQMPYPIRL
jgi:hypothetical protein